MKPSKEQIKAWYSECCFVKPKVAAAVFKRSPMERWTKAMELAYAAGRKAAMEEAVRICETTPPWPDSRPHIEAAIRAAMEADK